MANLTTPAATAAPIVKPAAPIKLISGEAEIKKGIASAETRGKSLQKDWHILACSVIAHIEQHRAAGVNANLANALVDSLPKGVRKNALLEWFQAFGAVAFNDETGKLMFDKARSTKQTAGEALPFWEFRKEPEYKAFDFDKALAALLSQAQRHLDKGNAADNINLDTIAACKAALPVPEKAATDILADGL